MNQVHTIRQEGELYLWKYTQDKNYPGYNMAWSNGGQEFFQKLLLVLASSDSGIYKTLSLSKPTATILCVPNNKNNQLTCFSKLKVELSDHIDWNFSFNNDIAHIALSQQVATKLSSLISNVKSQEELSFEQISFWW